MKNVKIKVNINHICLTIILFMLLWHYGFTSYFGNYYQIEETGKIIISSNVIINSISKILSLLSYISCVFLCFNYFVRKGKVTKLEFIYILIFLNMLIILFFKTTNPLSILFDLGKWNNRMGIITVIACSIFFYGANESDWKFIKKIICIFVFLSAILVFIILLTKPEIYQKRLYAYKWLHGFGVIVRLGVWIFILNNRKSKLASLFVLIVDIIMIIVLQARLYVVDFLLQLIFICILLIKNRYSNRKDKLYKKIVRILKTSIVFFTIFIIVLFMPNSKMFNMFPKSVQTSLTFFSERLTEDTRTAQAQGFFEYFWDSFPIGVGYNTDGIPSGVGESGIDCGYLNTMYIAGVLMVVLLIFLTVIPILKTWFYKQKVEDIAVISRATTWIIILFSSASTGFEIEFMFFILCAGRCSKLNRFRNKKNSVCEVIQ